MQLFHHAGLLCEDSQLLKQLTLKCVSLVLNTPEAHFNKEVEQTLRVTLNSEFIYPQIGNSELLVPEVRSSLSRFAQSSA